MISCSTALGGFYFTDLGKSRARDRDQGGVYYALADGSHIAEVVHPILTPNGIGLSPDGKGSTSPKPSPPAFGPSTSSAPGVLEKARSLASWRPDGRWLRGFQRFDSLAVDGAGNVCVATLVNGSVSVVAPDGRLLRQVPMPDMLCTNICFGGPDLRTAYVTLSGTGQLVAMEWPEAGLRLEYGG